MADNSTVVTLLIERIRGAVAGLLARGRAVAREAARPRPVLIGLAVDAFRSREELLVENALLRQQLIVAARAVKRPKFRGYERGLIVLLAAFARRWANAILLVRPETITRWHRYGFRLFWRWKSVRRRTTEPRVKPEAIELIRAMARDNRLWGAERIRGELLKVGIRISKRTVQKYMRRVRRGGPRGQRWGTFLRSHLHQTWACDFLQTYDLWFRPIFAFFIPLLGLPRVVVELGSRKVIHVAVTRNPDSPWVSQQLRNATDLGAGPRFLIRDRDDKFGGEFDRVARGVGTRVLKTLVRAPKTNAFCERFLGSVRRECLDHIIVLSERHLLEVLVEYCRYFDHGRTHQGIGQLIPIGRSAAAAGCGAVVASPVLRGLHHDYRRAA